MQTNRCPECGGRLTTNYCPMCMKRVPFFSSKEEDASSSHREEGHTCVSFEMPDVETPKKVRLPKGNPAAQKAGPTAQKKPRGKKKLSRAAVVAAGVVIVMSAMSVLTAIFGAVESIWEDAREPEINYEAFIRAGENGAQDVPDIDPVEIYHANDIVITVDGAGLYYDDYAMEVTIVNDSDRDITVSSDLLSVNGYMSTSSSLFMQVEEGETYRDYLRLDSYDLEDAGIEQVAQVEFYLDIYDSDEYTDIDLTDLITLNTQIAEGFVQPVDDSGWELYNDGGVRMVVKRERLATYGDYIVTLFLENSTDRTVCLSDDQMLLNGQETNGLLWIMLRPHTRAIDNLYLSDLEELGIDDLSQIEEVTIDMMVEYRDGWDTMETKKTTLTFIPGLLEE